MTADPHCNLGTAPGPDARKAGDRVPDVTSACAAAPNGSRRHRQDLQGPHRDRVLAAGGVHAHLLVHAPAALRGAGAARSQKLGVDEIVCVSVNDPFVMEEWGRNESADKVQLLPDGNAAFTRGMGMLVDKSDLNFGARSWRYSMLVRDGVIEKLFVEPDKPGDPFEVSDADTMLRYLDPKAGRPDEVAMLSREGCEFCARAKAALDEAGVAFTDISLPPLQRARALRAITGAQTTPQVFVNGQLIGDSEATLKWLAAR